MTNITNTALLADVRKVMKSSKTISRSEYRAKGNFASDTVERRFGSWTGAVKRAKSGK